MPAYHPPHKSLHLVASYRHRFAMARILFKNMLGDKIKLSALEYLSGGKSYTYRTLETLESYCPDTRWTLALGTDSVNQLPQWKNPEFIVKHCDILELKRQTESVQISNDLRQKLNLRVLNNEFIDISSTGVRDSLKRGDHISLTRFLPQEIVQYIKRFSLYREPGHANTGLTPQEHGGEFHGPHQS